MCDSGFCFVSSDLPPIDTIHIRQDTIDIRQCDRVLLCIKVRYRVALTFAAHGGATACSGRVNSASITDIQS